MVTIKKPKEIEILKTGGKILADVLSELVTKAKPGIKTIELDKLAEKLITQKGGIPSFKNYKSLPKELPFPTSICASVNNQLVHTPASNQQLKNGDILSIDIGMKYPAKGKGYFTDMAVTISIGKVSALTRKLIKVTKKALAIGISQIKPGNKISDISRAIQTYVEAEGFSVVRQLVGHGVGYEVHEEPRIPNYIDPKQKNPILKEGMILALEPMVNVGESAVKSLSDGWTVVTADNKLCAHFEHTVAVTKTGSEILTKS
jgi:methionyl aminopeptidase